MAVSERLFTDKEDVVARRIGSDNPALDVGQAV